MPCRSRRKPVPWSPIVKAAFVLACDHPLGEVDGSTVAVMGRLVGLLLYRHRHHHPVRVLQLGCLPPSMCLSLAVRTIAQQGWPSTQFNLQPSQCRHSCERHAVVCNSSHARRWGGGRGAEPQFSDLRTRRGWSHLLSAFYMIFVL